MNILQAISVLFTLKFNQSDGYRKRGQSAHEEHEEVLIGGVFVKGDAENTAPDGEKTNPHHDDLREFHQEQVVCVHFLVGSDHGHGAGFLNSTSHHSSGKGRGV